MRSQLKKTSAGNLRVARRRAQYNGVVRGRPILMKLTTLGLAIASQVFTFAPWAICQDNPAQPERHQIVRPIPESGGGRVELTALRIERDLSSRASESIIQLRGDAEIRMINCVSSGQGGARVCENAMVLRADEVNYNEKTGEIEANGNVRITPHRASDPRR